MGSSSRSRTMVSLLTVLALANAFSYPGPIQAHQPHQPYPGSALPPAWGRLITSLTLPADSFSKTWKFEINLNKPGEITGCEMRDSTGQAIDFRLASLNAQLETLNVEHQRVKNDNKQLHVTLDQLKAKNQQLQQGGSGGDSSKELEQLHQRIQQLSTQVEQLTNENKRLSATKPQGPEPVPATVATKLELVKLGNHRYYFSNTNDPLSWHSAQEFCHANGLALVSIESAEENKLVNDQAQRLYERSNWAIWLGGNDEGEEGNWVWEGSKKPLTWDKWDSDKPGGGEVKNCLVMHRSDGRWSDFECERAFVFVCKSP